MCRQILNRTEPDVKPSGNTGFGFGMTGYYLHIPNRVLMRLNITKRYHVYVLKPLRKLHIGTESVPKALKDNKMRHNTVNINNSFGCFDPNCVLCS